jgi:hypothetical protein
VSSGTFVPAGPMAPTAAGVQSSLPVSIDKAGPPFPRHALHLPVAEPAPLPRAVGALLPTPRSADQLTYHANAPPARSLIDRRS